MQLRFGECLFDSGSRRLTRGGEPVHLEPKAFELLELLLERAAGGGRQGRHPRPAVADDVRLGVEPDDPRRAAAARPSARTTSGSGPCTVSATPSTGK